MKLGRQTRTASSPVIWYADAEGAFKDEWANICDAQYPNIANADTVTLPTSRTSVDTSVKVSGAGSYRIEVQSADTDVFATNARRSELSLANPYRAPLPIFNRGDERWIGWQFRLDANYPTTPGLFDTTVNTNTFPVNWQIITQFKQLGSLGSPIHSLEIQNGHLWSDRTSNDPTNQYPGYTQATYWKDLGPVTTNTWMKVLLHTYFDSDPNNGMIEFYGDLGDGQGYRQLLSPKIQATQKISDGSDGQGDTGQTRSCHLRMGTYHSKNITLTNPAVVWFDRCVIATTRAAAEAKAFT